jgi:RND family efflux transporter MFP subunit
MPKFEQRSRLTVFVVAVAVAACGSGEQGGERWNEDDGGIPVVEAVEVRLGSLPLEERLAGSVVASNQTEIYAEVSARIVEVLAANGDAVEEGQPLVRLRDTELAERLRQADAGLGIADARVAQAEAELVRANSALDRMETIAERNLGTRADLDAARADALTAEAQIKLMEAELAQARSLVDERRSALAETVVRAPVTGVLGGRNAEVGQLATASTPLFVIGDPERVRVEITLTQEMLRYIETGTAVNVYPDTNTEGATAIAASISRISPFLHPVTRTTPAEIDVGRHGGRLLPGMFVTVDVLYGQTELAPLVPNSAVYRDARDGREGVFVASLEEAGPPRETVGQPTFDPTTLEPVGPVPVRFVPVQVTARGRQTSSLRGVEPGQWVVTLGHHLLSSNDSGLALVQPTAWDHILRLQDMQSRDLLRLIEQQQNGLGGGAEALN